MSIALRCVAFFHYRFDSDEPQHLHVAWGWTQGLVQYRDVFDNHAPLFHIVTAPFLAAVGERADVLFAMRALMLPLFLTVLTCTFVIARRVYSSRVALWTVVLLSLFPPFFLKSIEYRTDNLWNALWLAAVTVLLPRAPRVMSWGVAGFVLGCALAVSLKTTVLVVTLALASASVRFILRDRTSYRAPLAAAAAGFVIVPSLIATWFIAKGAWPNLVHCVFTFNTFLDEGPAPMRIGYVVWPVAVAAVALIARRTSVRDPRRMFCAIAIAMFCVTILCLWPVISPRDLLPVMPLAAMFASAAILRLDERAIACTTTAVLFAASLFYYTDRFRNHTEEFITMMNQALRLTRISDPIMDLKGETIYRRRPFYYILELIGRSAIRRGTIADTIPEDVVRARCYVAQADGPQWPDRGRAFLSANFMDMGRLRAAGQWIRDDGSFTIAVPGPYVIVNERGQTSGILDGVQYSGPRDLGAGAHRFVRTMANERIAVLWAPALARGFSPFHLQDRDFRYTGRHSRSARYR